jgi:hypothetical protein
MCAPRTRGSAWHQHRGGLLAAWGASQPARRVPRTLPSKAAVTASPTTVAANPAATRTASPDMTARRARLRRDSSGASTSMHSAHSTQGRLTYHAPASCTPSRLVSRPLYCRGVQEQGRYRRSRLVSS